MQLNGSTDYAVRILMYLGEIDRMASAREIAEQMNIPPNYITGLNIKLKNSGYLTSAQGSVGGYRITEKAKNSTLLDIISLMEGQLLEERCTVCEPSCRLYKADGTCPVGVAYRAMQGAVQSTALNITLRNLLSMDCSESRGI